LQSNARCGAADLARQLGVARATVLARVAPLERTGVIVGYTVRLVPIEAGAGVEAYVGITVAPRGWTACWTPSCPSTGC
jgi:DNA-binding Lrp family transcriptional regulator